MVEKKIVIVGDVPQAVLDHVSSKYSMGIAKASKLDAIEISADYMILHVPRAPSAELMDILEEWINSAADEDVRIGITSEAGMNADVSFLLFKRGIQVMRLLNDGAAVNLEAVGQLLAADTYIERRKDDDVPIGQYFTWTDDPREYAAQRQLSLSSATMEATLQKLRDAVLAMQTPLPDAVRRLTALPPWNPAGPLTSSSKLPNAPSLMDVFRLHDAAEARRLLQPEGSDGWTAPKLLIRGESGSGKTLVARLVSDLIARGMGKERSDFPFVTVNCAALRGVELQHQLFGAAARQWADITEPVVGELAKAGHGVAFLDEIGDMELGAQRGLLVFLQDGIIRPFGIDPYPSFTRVIAATNRDVPLLIERQQFRNDLNARFDFQIEIPSLREREEGERARLIDFAALNPQHNPGKRVTHISRNALDALAMRDYSVGNFREMETAVHTALAKTMRRRSTCIRTKDLPEEGQVLTVLDGEANIINVLAPPQGLMVDVRSQSDLTRAANLMSAPVLRTADGSQYVLAAGHVLRLPASQSDSSSPLAHDGSTD